MNAAADAGGIAESMSKTASSAQQAGVSIDQLIGMIATLTDVSQASPENVGTAMKSIISRYTQVKANNLLTMKVEMIFQMSKKSLQKWA